MDGQHTFTIWLSNFIGGSVILSALVGYAPAFAAVIAVIWYLIQIYESATVQRWLALRRNRKIARLKAKVLMMEAQSRPPLPGPEQGGL